MLTVALTGGLASGKSFVGETLRDLGCCLIQADHLGHLVLMPDGEAYPRVVREFGTDILDESGAIDRRRLAERVFSHPERLELLSSLVHPPVRARVTALIAEYAAVDPAGIAVVEAAIHIETGGYKLYDKLILAWCDDEQQIARAMRRDHSTREQVLARLANQMPLAEKRKFADYVIDTSGTKQATVVQVRTVYNSLRGIAQ